MTKKLIEACAWCKRVQVGDKWVEIGPDLRVMMSEAEKAGLVSHGICPDCEKSSFMCCRHCENILDAGAQYCRVCGAVVEQ